MKIIDEPFTCIKQSIGVKKGSKEVIKFLNKLIVKLINNGFIKDSLLQHRVGNKLSIPILV